VEKVQQDTGIWAVRLLAASLAVTPARRVLGWGWALQYRRMLGLLAFFYATLHLANFVVLDHFFAWSDVGEDIFERPWITIGMAAWVLLVPLALTSTKGWIRRLGGRRWNALHRLVYLAATGVVIHFFLAMKKDLREPLVYAAVIGGLLLVRVVVAARERSARGRVAGAPSGAPARGGQGASAS
jgi:methionine sulfoxide reductase heme-binding subunit